MFNKGQLAGLMKQAQAMQDNLKKAQEELAHIEVEGESGAGLVKVLMTAKHDVKRVTIDPSLLADDKDMLEDLVAAAFNAAVRKAEEVSAEKMGKVMPAGMPGLPGGMKFPFCKTRCLAARSCLSARRCWPARAASQNEPAPRLATCTARGAPSRRIILPRASCRCLRALLAHSSPMPDTAATARLGGNWIPMRAGCLLPPDAFTRPPHAVRHDTQLNLF